MATFNIKAKQVGTVLTLTIDLSKDCGPTEKGNNVKIATNFYEPIPGLPEGHKLSMVLMRAATATKKTAKKVAKEVVEEKPTLAKKANKKSAPVAVAKKTTKKTTKKTAKVADDTNEEDVEQDVFAPNKNKKRAA